MLSFGVSVILGGFDRAAVELSKGTTTKPRTGSDKIPAVSAAVQVLERCTRTKCSYNCKMLANPADLS